VLATSTALVADGDGGNVNTALLDRDDAINTAGSEEENLIALSHQVPLVCNGFVADLQGPSSRVRAGKDVPLALDSDGYVADGEVTSGTGTDATPHTPASTRSVHAANCCEHAADFATHVGVPLPRPVPSLDCDGYVDVHEGEPPTPTSPNLVVHGHADGSSRL
jgi:hypothetical protein